MPEPARASPRVAVVVATNRGGPFLEEALRSVVAQTLTDWELVVVDDGATDAGAVRRAVEAVGDARVRLLRIPASGVSRARNHGVAQTSGAILAFLDDDDRWDARRLELGIAPFGDDAVVATYCGLRTIDADGVVLVQADQVPVASGLDVARGRGGILLPNLLLRRSALNEVGEFSPRLRMAEDLDLVLRLVAVGDFVLVPTSLVDYRHHADNTTSRYRALAVSIREIVRQQRDAAKQAGDRELVVALRERDRANDRFAAWSAARSAREALGARKLGSALGDVGWAATFAPWAPFLWLRRRLRG
ncbi:glycosyltransferase family 2 protein [Luteimicrobium sp. DT211]|uniref:glycosyltransferase family 2 protein n=1 Tax=Luteimicrobium sp. DT211 TaxID=3393412 RepID=UPI003CF6D550